VPDCLIRELLVSVVRQLIRALGNEQPVLVLEQDGGEQAPVPQQDDFPSLPNVDPPENFGLESEEEEEMVEDRELNSEDELIEPGVMEGRTLLLLCLLC
jgi:hypothetical protein